MVSISPGVVPTSTGGCHAEQQDGDGLLWSVKAEYQQCQARYVASWKSLVESNIKLFNTFKLCNVILEQP